MSKITENKLKQIINELKNTDANSLKEAARINNHSERYYYNLKASVKDSNISKSIIDSFMSICEKFCHSKENVETDDRAVIDVERDENGLIQFYTFEIFRKNRNPIVGKFDRKDMEKIYNMYSIYGSNLSQKVISREFPEYSFVDFKRIIKCLGIYKHDYIPKHWIEELEEEEIIQRCHRNKESNIMRKLEKDELSEYKKLTSKLASKLQIYESKIGIAKELLQIKDEFLDFKSSEINILNKSNLIIYLSDLHIGAFNEPNGYLKLENYNEEEIIRRISKILEIPRLSEYDSIIIMNLGDSVDSYNKETTRGGHELPTIISNKEQSQLFIRIMVNFFNSLVKINPNVSYYCIGESNHDGDWGWINNIVLSEKLKQLNIKSYISENPIDCLNVNDVSIIYLHGKNNKDQFKGFPLTLNKQTESWFNDYFVDCEFNLKKNKIVVKGDLHQFAITEGHNFQYLSVASMYGSSQYIVSNFGKTRWGITYMEIDALNNIKIGNIKENGK